MSERHLRRSLTRELGVTRLQLAQTHRMLLAKRLLADTGLPVIRVAEASEFRSLRRFNAIFRERYRMPPTTVRRNLRQRKGVPSVNGQQSAADDMIRLTLAYRAPMNWDGTLALLARRALTGVESIAESVYFRTVEIDGLAGVIRVQGPDVEVVSEPELRVEASASLLPALTPLIAGLRRPLDLEADPVAIDSCLMEAGLGSLVRQRPGLRVPGAFDPFAAALQGLLTPGSGSAARVVRTLGAPATTVVPELDRLVPRPKAVVAAGRDTLREAGVPESRAAALVGFARVFVSGSIRLEPDDDPVESQERLLGVEGIDGALADLLTLQALDWPDAFPGSDPELERAAGVPDRRALEARAEHCRPWRAYAAHHLWLAESPAETE